jgi:hypothetical protein
MPFTVERDIACPPEHAFDLMADARNETTWNSRVSRSELVSGEPIGAGTTFVTVNRGQEYDATIATHERPERLVFDVRGRQMDITASFRFAAAGSGTHISGEFDFRPKGVMRGLFPLFAPMVRRDLERQSASFAALCEST